MQPNSIRLVLCAPVFLLACHREPPPLSVVLVMVDTLRADRMSLYGAAAETTPNLERLAERAVVFEQAASDAGCTFPSVNSVLTSQWPHRQLARIGEVGMAIPADVPTLAEVLLARGYDTAAISSSIIVRKSPSKINHQGGFDAGFTVFDEQCLQKRAPCVNRGALGRLETLREPFFLYLHYLDPHAPYRPPEWFESRVEVPPGVRRWARRGELEPLFAQLYDEEEGPPLGETELDLLRQLYDEEIRFFDARFAELMAELDRRGLLERSVVVLMSDHGEELMDHEHAGHCRDMAYQTLMHTPLVVWLPGARFTGRRRSLVQNLDVMPTLLDLLGVDEPGLAMDGVSLRPTLESDEPVRRFTSSLQGVARTLRVGRWKLIAGTESDARLLFDLDADPGETRDLAAREPALARDMADTLDRLLQQIDGGAAADTARGIEDHLRRLGYL